MKPELLALAPMWYVIFLLSAVCHEAAHALAAKLGGDPTAYEEGQVSLNPLPHIRREPLGTVVFPIVTYLINGWMLGWASAPYDPEWQAMHPRRAAWMSLAGPAANFCLVLLAALLILGGIQAGIFQPPSHVSFRHIVESINPGFGDTAAVFLSILFSLNLLLGVFNLLPIPPLDGSTALGLFMSEETAVRYYEYVRNPSFSLIGLIIAWQVFDEVFSPVFIYAINLLY